MKKTAHACVISALLAGPAAAQSSDWSYSATLYGWLPALGTTLATRFGTVDAELSQSDVLSNLDMAAMAVFEARNGPWSLISDVFYSDLSGSQPTPFGLRFSEAIVETQLTMVSGLVAYRAYETQNVSVDVGAGLRLFKVDMGLTLTAGRRPAESSSTGKTWVDPILAARVIVPFNDKWSATAYVDFGGTGSDDETWQALASISYQINDRWSTQFGYRELDLKNVIGGRLTTINLSGPFIAASYKF